MGDAIREFFEQEGLDLEAIRQAAAQVQSRENLYTELMHNGRFHAKVRIVKNKTGEILSPRLNKHDSGAVTLSICFEVVDDFDQVRGAHIWDRIPIFAAKCSNPDEYNVKNGRCLAMAFRKLIPLSGEEGLWKIEGDWKTLKSVLGYPDFTSHKMTKDVIITVQQKEGRRIVKMIEPFSQPFKPAIW